MDGIVREVNENFARVMGYTRAEVVGKHHSQFVESAYAGSAEYRAFWEKLNRGESDINSYKRIAKGGREVWIQASYNPIPDVNGKPFKVVKYATDITEQKVRAADFEGQLAAISRAQAVIEFELDGTIRSVNDNFTSGRWATRTAKCAASITACSSIRPSAAARNTARSGPSSARGEAGRRSLPARRQGRSRSVVAGFVQPDPRCQRPSVQGGQVRHRRDRSRCRWRSSSS